MEHELYAGFHPVLESQHEGSYDVELLLAVQSPIRHAERRTYSRTHGWRRQTSNEGGDRRDVHMLCKTSG
eukprot:scaffold135241_cov28-Tisochrysis_lutea.AAC.3